MAGHTRPVGTLEALTSSANWASGEARLSPRKTWSRAGMYPLAPWTRGTACDEDSGCRRQRLATAPPRRNALIPEVAPVDRQGGTRLASLGRPPQTSAKEPAKTGEASPQNKDEGQRATDVPPQDERCYKARAQRAIC